MEQESQGIEIAEITTGCKVAGKQRHLVQMCTFSNGFLVLIKKKKNNKLEKEHLAKLFLFTSNYERDGCSSQHSLIYVRQSKTQMTST